jgi:1,2-diacylglycerol 3-alpha-glucosyltransferase
MGNLAVVAARLLDVPCVSTVHTQYELLANKARPIPPRLVKRVLLFGLKSHAKQVDLLTTPGGGSLRRLLDLGIKTPIELVSNPTDLKEFWGADGSAVRSEWCISPEQRLIGYFGRLSPEKNLLVLLEAFAYVAQFDSGVRLMIVGDGPSRQELEKYAAAQLPGRVSFTGRVAHELIAPYYAAFDFFATASMFEVQPMTLAEALAVGTPVIGFDVAGVNDMIDFENGRLIDPWSGAPGLALGMISLLRDPFLIEMLSRKAIRSAEKFDQSLAVGRMLEIYSLARDLHRARRDR